MGGKLIKWLVILVFLPVVAFADTIQIKQSAPQVYVVEKGDTLWEISNMYLDRPWLWPELWRNNVHITNPHLIYPGDELRLRYNEQGEPELVVEREAPKQEIKISPQGHRKVKNAQPIPALPWSVIRPYIENDTVMDQKEYDFLPYLLGNQDGAIRFYTDNLVVTKGGRRTRSEYNIVRKQNDILDMFGNVLGVQVRHVADALPVESDMQTELLVNVKQSNFEAKRGDKLMLPEKFDMKDIVLKAANRQKGHIVDSLESYSLLGKFSVVIIDIGSRQVSPGTVMGIYMQGPVIYDGENPAYEGEDNYLASAFGKNEIYQPALKVGELVVFKSFEKTSYALITKSTKIVRRGAIVAKP